MKIACASYEYAGFRYVIEDHGGGRLIARPLPEQHNAVWKEKHRRAAVDCYKQDQMK